MKTVLSPVRNDRCFFFWTVFPDLLHFPFCVFNAVQKGLAPRDGACISAVGVKLQVKIGLPGHLFLEEFYDERVRSAGKVADIDRVKQGV